MFMTSLYKHYYYNRSFIEKIVTGKVMGVVSVLSLRCPETAHIFYAGSPTNQPTEVAIPIGHPYFITVFPIGRYPTPGELGNFV
jgi:hypothetical protein